MGKATLTWSYLHIECTMSTLDYQSCGGTFSIARILHLASSCQPPNLSSCASLDFYSMNHPGLTFFTSISSMTPTQTLKKDRVTPNYSRANLGGLCLFAYRGVRILATKGTNLTDRMPTDDYGSTNLKSHAAVEYLNTFSTEHLKLAKYWLNECAFKHL